MIHLGECHRKNLCVDCDMEICGHAGKKEADCPHYHCPYPNLDCETECSFIDRFIEEMRRKNED